jgi:hypothetical protein
MPAIEVEADGRRTPLALIPAGCKMAFMALTDIRQPDILHRSPDSWGSDAIR